MRTFVKTIAIIIIVASFVSILHLSSIGYWEHIEDIKLMIFVSLVGYGIFIYGVYMPLTGKAKEEFEKEIILAARALERKALREKMNRWNNELSEEEREQLSK